MDIPNELTLIIFNFIKKITDKRQFIRTCKLHNTLLKGLITKMSESELDYFGINNNKNNNHVDILEKKVYYSNYLNKRNYCVEKFMMELCYDSYFNMIPLSYLTENIGNIVIIKLLIKYGKLELLQLVLNCKPAKLRLCKLAVESEQFTKLRLCELAAESGQLNILKWLFENGYYLGWGYRICATAALNGHFDILKWAREQGCEWDKETCAYAAKYGDLDILKWARKNGCEWDNSTCSFAASGGHLNVLKWARENGCNWDYNTCSAAASQNHLNVLKWARENGCEWNKNTIFHAKANESLDTLKWASENGCPE